MREEGRFAGGGFREIADDGDEGTFDFAAIEALIAIAGFPCAVFFARAREEIGVERADEIIVLGVVNFKGLDVFMPDWIGV